MTDGLSFPSIFSLKLFPAAGKRPEDWEPQLHTSIQVTRHIKWNSGPEDG